MEEVFESPDWVGAGYTTFPDSAEDGSSPKRFGENIWRTLATAVSFAKNGRFSQLTELGHLVLETGDARWEYIVAQVLGDAGDAECLERYIPIIQENSNLDDVITAGRALYGASRLADVPALFYAFEMNCEARDANIISSWIRRLLEPGGVLPELSACSSFADYRRAVAHLYHTLCDRWGSDLIYVYAGAQWDVVEMAKHMHSNLKKEIFQSDWRHRFEASTGIDCSGFYHQGILQPLRAASILESFLESPHVNYYKSGSRYFFGHPLEPAIALEGILLRYGPDEGLRAPFARTALTNDVDFSLDLGFRWRRGGYFGVPRAPVKAEYPRHPEHKRWLSLAVALREAKRGNRTLLSRLAELVEPAGDSTFNWVCTDFLSDAADGPVVARMRVALEGQHSSDFTFDLCCALLRRGYLSDVPHVLSAYARHAENDSFDYLQVLFNELFLFVPIVAPNASPNFSSFGECRTAVEKRYTELCSRLGNTNVPVFRNEVFSVEAVAREIIKQSFGPFFSEDLRRRFEASTGIDCTAFFDDRLDLRQDAAVQIAQSFLSSSAAHNFKRGKRYFFGCELLP